MSCTAKDENSSSKVENQDATQAVIENIMTRTSIRQFTDQPVAKDTLDLLVKAGMAAPTAMNKQPWAFIVITDKEMLNALNEVKPWFNLKTATAAIVVCGDLSKEEKDWSAEYWVQDCSAATENILLAAHAYGLGAVWCGVYPNPEILPAVTKLLGTPEHIVPLNVITLGYPAENPAPKDKFNAESIHYQKW
ncbi:MAG: nitroreductase family protein [Muribaculaceae bacterium]|nr:nitroreductase family protein [Muribaculaceae bacterium]